MRHLKTMPLSELFSSLKLKLKKKILIKIKKFHAKLQKNMSATD